MTKRPEPIEIIARCVRHFRVNPLDARAALPQVEPDDLIAKEIIDALVCEGYALIDFEEGTE